MTDEEILDAYNRAGSKSAAARELGLSRSAFRRRLDKIQEEPTFLETSADSMGFPAEQTEAYWVKTPAGSFYVRANPQETYERLRQDFIEDAKNYAPKYEPIPYLKNSDHLLVIDPADVHFGKLSVASETGYSYNLAETKRRFKEGISTLLWRAKTFGIDRIVFVVGNDLLHYDTPFRKTTGGTPQDTDGMWHEMFQTAKWAVIESVEEASRIAEVHLVHGPSNHDYQLGYCLSDSIGSWFWNHPNVNVSDCLMNISHRKYIQYGSNLIGFTHGDGAKEKDLPALMAFEARKQWAESKYAVWYTHHTHHKDRKAYGKNDVIRIEKDFIGVTVVKSANLDVTQKTFVETVRSPSAPDGWHDRNGYVNQQAIECFIHHVDDGPVGRFATFF